MLQDNEGNDRPRVFSNLTLVDDANVTDNNQEQQQKYFNSVSTVNDTMNEKSLSTTSSPFITNPEISANKDLTERKDLETFDKTDKNLFEGSNIMDSSIASLRESLKILKVSNNNGENYVRSASRNHDENSFITNDTSEIEDTKAQLDYNFDHPYISSKIPSRLENSPTPWRKLRSSTAFTISNPAINHPSKNLAFDRRSSAINGIFSTQEASSSSKIDELNKQITGYKIQIKFFKQFLQSLVDKSQQTNASGLSLIDFNELNKLQDSWKGLLPPDRPRTQELDKLETNYNKLIEDFEELSSLNEDLYENLEKFQHELEEKDIRISNMNQQILNCTNIVNEILSTIGASPTTDEESSEAISRCLNIEESHKSLSIKLLALKLEISKVLEHLNKSNNFNNKNSLEYTSIINDLINSLETVRNEFSLHRNETFKLEEDLKTEVEQSKTLKKTYDEMVEKFSQICKTLEERDSNTTKVRSNTPEISYKKAAVDVNNSQNESFDRSSELIIAHREYNYLEGLYKKLTDNFRSLEETSSKTIEDLTDQLKNLQKEINTAKSIDENAEKLKQELDVAVEKQRILKAEKARLSYTLESLTNEKISLQSKVESLTEKFSSVSVADSQDNSEAKKNLNILEYRLEDLLLFDIHKFQRLLKSFNKIADDSSLKEPARKIDFLYQRSTKSHEDFHLIDSNDFSVIKEYHKSVSEYFIRAVDIIVNDHVKLLLKENETTSHNNKYIAKLHRRIDDLNNKNDELSKQLDLYDAGEQSDFENTTSSPRTKLRIEELSTRWKAEREARVYENKEAHRRLKELELENSRLRAS